jgi:hypothetical protein
MRLAGWKSRAMLQRYGASAADVSAATTRAMSYADRHGPDRVSRRAPDIRGGGQFPCLSCGYCLAIAMRVRCSGSRRWSWLSRPASSRTQLIVPLNLLCGAR